MLYYHRYFLHRGFKFQSNVCSGCHDLLMIYEPCNIAILKIKCSDYHCIISGISKNEAIKCNANLTEKSGTLYYFKMANENLTFGNIEIGKKKFYHYKSPVLLRDVEIEKVLVSNKTSFGEKNYKYFIGYLYNDNRVKPLHIIFPKTSGYVKSYDGKTKWMYFLIEDDKLLEKHNTI